MSFPSQPVMLCCRMPSLCSDCWRDCRPGPYLHIYHRTAPYSGAAYLWNMSLVFLLLAVLEVPARLWLEAEVRLFCSGVSIAETWASESRSSRQGVSLVSSSAQHSNITNTFLGTYE